jgi:hydroxymethylglutaryl-CoA lyase
VEDTIDWMREAGVCEVSLADTAGVAGAAVIAALFKAAKLHAHGIELGVHLHSRPESAAEKISAAYEAGCRRFDGALTGLGGCPFAGDDLVGNVATEVIINTLNSRGARTEVEPWGMLSALEATKEIRGQYGETPSALGHLGKRM